MNSSLRPRTVAWLLLPIVLIALWLVLRQERPLDRAADSSAALNSQGADVAQLGSGSQQHAQESRLSRSNVSEESGDKPEGWTDGTSLPVHLRVLLRVPDEEGEEHIPANCAGWVVRAQSWDSETGEAFGHEAVANAHGVAAFRFPGEVHVDWVTCAPPPASGFGLSQLSQHNDFSEDSEAEWTLLLLPAGHARGRVLTLSDQPVAQAEVFAFDPSWASGLETWEPGFLAVRTAADGSFQFDALAEGDWAFAVSPNAYLQIVPPLGEAFEGAGYATVVRGETADAGVLRVLAADTQEIRVVDVDGNGVQKVLFAISTLSLVSPHVRPALPFLVDEEANMDSMMERFLAGEDPSSWSEPAEIRSEEDVEDLRPEWPYERFTRETDTDGRLLLRLPPGRYSLECWTTIPEMPGGTISPFEFSVPGPPVLFRLPVKCGPWSGRVVDELGDPVPNASVILEWQDDEGSASVAVNTNAQGAFHFENVALVRQCELELSCGGYVTAHWQVSLLEQPAIPFCLPHGGTLHVLCKGPTDAPVNLNGVQARLWPIHTSIPPPAPGSLGGSADAGSGTPVWASQDQLHAYQLASGEHELTLTLAHFQSPNILLSWMGPAGAYQFSEAVEIGSWRVQTGDEWNVIQLSEEQCALLTPIMVAHSGVVVDAETGLPLKGATLNASGLNLRSSASTGADGQFSLELAEGKGEVQISADGYRTLTESVVTKAGADLTHEFRLQHGGALIYLRVLDREGRRLPPCTADLLLPDSTASTAGMELPWAELQFQSNQLGTHRIRLSFGSGVQADASFNVEQARGSLAVDCRISWTLTELRSALRAAR